MTGTLTRRIALAALAAALPVLAWFPTSLPAQEPPDQPGLPASPASPDNPAPSGTEANPALPPTSPPGDPSSSLLPSSPPLPPRPSVPNASLLPDNTPPPAATPPPLPVVLQTDSAHPPGAPGAPTTAAGGATTTSVTGAVRRFQYAFRLTTGVTYDDNVFLTSNGSSPGTDSLRRGFSRHDAFFSIDPSVSLGYGDFLTRATNYVEFDYTADALLYVKNTDQDTVQHFFNFQGAYHFAQITLTFSQSIQLLDSTDLGNTENGSLLGSAANNNPSSPNTQVNLDTSRRTGLDVFNTSLDGNYAFSDKTSVDLAGYFSAADYETLISSDTLSGSAFFNYSPTGKITLGLGGSVGYTIQTDPAPNEFYEQINLRLSYAATTKLSASGSVGVEAREVDGGGGTEVTPIFDLSISYAPFDSTSLALTASRRVQTSAVLTGEDFDSTGFSFSISQRFFQRLTARLSLGYTYSSYVTAGRGTTTNRADNYYYLQPSLDYSLRDNLSVGVSFIRRQDFSSLAGNGFADDQVSAHVSLNF